VVTTEATGTVDVALSGTGSLVVTDGLP